eukprot:4815183-Amphidinium_carterae.1
MESHKDSGQACAIGSEAPNRVDQDGVREMSLQMQGGQFHRCSVFIADRSGDTRRWDVAH